MSRATLDLPAPVPLLGLALVRDAEVVVVTEGPFDWLIAVRWRPPAMAVGGAMLAE
ncbi:MAG: hypothetical protein O7F08_01190 [Deltaproteobacteria bacterium]|nr:hypothetical protein [Deltaproteobacteria bacterium]